MTEMRSSLRRSALVSAIVALAAIVLNASTASAQLLGSASSFAALAGGPATGAVTCTGPGSVTGNVGVVPPGSIVNTGCTVAGTLEPTAAVPYADFLTAFRTLKSSTSTPCGRALNPAVSQTLAPGVYCIAAAAAFTGVTLTLNGPATGVWIFKIGTGGTGALTGTGFSVVMAGGGQSCNVYWWVAEAATMTGSSLKGTLLAGADITTTDSILKGAVLAGGSGSTFLPTGAVTLTRSLVSVCNMGSSFPPVEKCDGDHDGDHDKDHHKDKHHHTDKDHDKDNDHDKDKNYKDHDSKDGKRW
jgi:Ice-binding-like